MSAAVFRARREGHGKVHEEEDATKLEFGPEFSFPSNEPEAAGGDLYALSLSETRYLLNTCMASRHEETATGQNEEDEEDFANSNEVLRKTREYLSVFARFKDEQTIDAVEHLLKSPENSGLHPFEIAQLANLMCDDAEEAKTLIPSLAFKKSDEDLQVLLDQLRRFT
ncbi:DNA-directed RNA polymerase II subunit [Starmerella bacillaris]|uniref:DNA-directed RNA polymerase II subunit n=1 Tax=Starmerella bacillaris TaxID=1247836 RepID=A0AAV5RQ25_STABA|nr:DNA-directed RNA polymerase II subunit [Starmerella bacillaris]